MNTKLSRRVLALLLAMVMIAGILPQSAFAHPVQGSDTQVIADGQSVELPEYIFTDSWNPEYDVLYHEEGKTYTHGGEAVTFPDASTVMVGQKTHAIKNAVTKVSVKTAEGKTEITLSNLNTPVGSISGAWNSTFDGRFALHYQQNGQPVKGAETDRISRLSLTVDTPKAGTYTLTGGKLFEGANTYSPGFDFKDGKGTVKEREFGYLPDITFTVESEQPTPPVKPEPPAKPEPQPEETVPFTAKLGENALTVQKVEDVRCDATFQNVPVYQITIPAGTKDKTLSISGLKDWGYIENACTGASDGTIADQLWQTNILGKDQYYHLSKGRESFHITFNHLGDFEPAGPVIPFTAKAGEQSLTVIKQPRAGHYGYDLYTVQIPKGLKDANVQLGGLKGLSYMQNKLIGKLEQITDDPWSVKLLGKDEYLIIRDIDRRLSYEIRFQKEELPQVPVLLTGQMDGAFLLPPETAVQLEPGLAKSLGYTYGDGIKEEDVTVLDALVKMHQIVFGEDDITEYFKVNESGWITCAFGEETTAVGYMQNGEMPTTVCNETVLHPNDNFQFFNYQDTTGYSDKAAWLEQEGQKQDRFDVEQGKPLTLTVRSKDYSGNVSPVSGVQLATVDEHGNTTPIDGAVTKADGTVSATFDAPGSYTLTVLSSDTTKVIMPIVHVAVTTPQPEEIPMADPSIPDDFENDLWLQYNYLQMKVGDNATIYPRRVPQIIDSAIGNGVSRPNFHFEVIQGNSVTLDKVQSNDRAQVRAVRDGVSIVKVTYDALGKYGASSRVNTAYVVYDVNNAPANLTITTSLSKIRSYDTLYYTEGDTLAYDFTVEVPGAQKVEVTCNGRLLSAGEGGRYTAQLENRSNILGIRATDENGKTKTGYYVIDARKIRIDVENLTHPGQPFQVNDKAKISFYGITMPVYKLATIYNPCFGGHDDLNQKDTWPTSVMYQNDQLGELHGFCHQWDLATTNSFEVTFRQEGEYRFTGGNILCNWWGSPLGSDKDKYGSGDPNFAAPILSDHFSSLPDFTVQVGEASGDKVPVKGIALDRQELTLATGQTQQLKATVTPSNASDPQVIWSCDDADGSIITVDDKGMVTAKGAVTAEKPFVTVTAKTKDGGFTATCKVIVTEADKPTVPPAPQQKDAVVLTVEGHTVGKGYLVKPVEIKLQPDDTAFSVMKRYVEEHGISLTAQYNEAYGSYYVSEIGGLREMQHGPGSGWMYFVDEQAPGTGASSYVLKGGEVIRWRYTTNMGQDLKPDVTPGTTHTVKAEQPENGSIALSPEKAEAGKTVTVTVKAEAGYALEKLTVTDAKGTEIPVTSGENGTFTFTMPSSDVQVRAQLRRVSAELPDYQTILNETGRNLAGRPNGFGGEWVAMALARHGYPVDSDYFENYYKDVERQVIEKKGVLSNRKYTEYSRTILALTAAGYDVTDVGGYDLTAPLADFEKVNFQGINGTVFALIALDSHGYEIPALTQRSTQTTREKLVEEILSKYLPEGGWSIFGKEPDVDTTAMAIQALAPYYSSNEQVKEAVDHALAWLSKTQNDDGNWMNQDGNLCSETPAQVLVALTAMGIDPISDARFVKNGRTVIHAICDFYLGEGAFSHVTDGGANGMATEQSYYALVSYLRFNQGKTGLYDMSDVTIGGQEPEPEVTEPKPTQPDVTKPEETKPEETKPEATKPAQPGKPQKPGKAPNTGDEAPVYLLAFAMAASAAGAAFLLKKKERDRA